MARNGFPSEEEDVRRCSAANGRITFLLAPATTLREILFKGREPNSSDSQSSRVMEELLLLTILAVTLRVIDVAATKDLEGPQSRFLSPADYEGLGRIFALHSELASCHICSASYPNHAESCCSQGFSNCCLNGQQQQSSTAATTSSPTFFPPVETHPAPGSLYYQVPPSVIGSYPSIKEGTCPSPTYAAGLAVHPALARHCIHECLYDSECPQDLKCCWTGCSMGCSRPALYSGISIRKVFSLNGLIT